MYLHNYDPNSGEFLSTALADESPLEEGVFLIPANATQVEPPACATGQVAVFNGEAWSVVADVRGIWYDAGRQALSVNRLDVDVQGLTRIAPPSPAYDLAAGAWVLNAQRDIEHVKAQLSELIQRHLDSAAHARGYDSILSAVTYAGEPAVPAFQAEGQAFRAWRSLVWARCYQLAAEVQAGKRPVPTPEALIALLPALVLP